jgi:hypothetical protein
MRKVTVVIFNQYIIRKNKLIDNFEKKIIKKNTMWGNTVAIHSAL